MTHHASAVSFWKRLLYAATAVSVVCNSAHAMLEKDTDILGMAVAGVLAALPPLMFFFIVEGIARAVKSGIGGVSYVIGLLFAAALGAGAFIISFNSLYMFAHDWGVFDEHLVLIFPALVDAVMALSTYMLLAMGDKPTKRVKKPKETNTGVASVGLIPWLKVKFIGGAATVPTLPEQPLSTPSTVQSAVSSHPENIPKVDGGRAPVQRAVSTGRSPSVSRPVGTPVTWTVDDADHLAGRLRATGKTELPIETVTAILVGFAEGQSGRALATAAGVSPTTAQTLRKAAAELAAEHVLEAVG